MKRNLVLITLNQIVDKEVIYLSTAEQQSSYWWVVYRGVFDTLVDMSVYWSRSPEKLK